MESKSRYFRRRAVEEYTASQRAVTDAARDRRIDLAKRFLGHLDDGEAHAMLFDWGLASVKMQTRARKANGKLASHA